ncbi:4Fe-4S binding protein [Ilyobacter polytropus]|uniref:2-oxoglutarate ferredoxin oxidoreductase, delta subunit n=1 Tax=Ilyobacter polytropus (strain ATCC 51220 / DSM 2926 / LMG 16218 / CuHBu1) TaxID=572544 RepID=E3H658_ILYPC|nr:4Fe-4S binding protein [Ilyobacter polytropus]ADO81817.1 2-oxoglutarate ferredoxin oxidoreductase, delta subunit [Ilyobacter polytropus DSM 2926]
MGKGIVTFNEERCKGCGLCTVNCPVNIVFLQKNKINSKGYNPAGVTDPDKCIGCGNCAIMCPDLVIRVKKI